MSFFEGPSSAAAFFAAVFFADIGTLLSFVAVSACPGRPWRPDIPAYAVVIAGRERFSRTASGAGGSDVAGGVDGVAVLVDLEVEVAARRGAGGADVADGGARRDLRPDRLGVALQVVVRGGDQMAVHDAVAEDGLVAGAAAVGAGDDPTGMRGLDRDPAGDREVDAGMELPGAVDRVDAPAEVRVQPGVDGVDPAARGGRRTARGPAAAAAAVAAVAALLLLLPLAALALLALGALAFLPRKFLDLGVERRAARLQGRDLGLVLRLLGLQLLTLRLLLRVEGVQRLLRLGGLRLGLLSALDRLLRVDLELRDLLPHSDQALRGVLGDGLVGAQGVQTGALRGHGEAVVHGAVHRVLRRGVADVDRGRVRHPAALVGVQRRGGELLIAGVDLLLALLDLSREPLLLGLRRGEALTDDAVLLAGLLQLALGLLEI